MVLPLLLALAVVLAAAAGLVAGLLIGRSRADAAVAAATAGSARLSDSFAALSARALAANNEQFLALADTRLRQAGIAAAGDLERRRQAVDDLVAPLADTLDRVQGQLRDLEADRRTAYARLTEQVSFARESSEQVREQTAALVTALRAPQTRGRWGELQLRRVVEIAGMVEHCDFDEQPSFPTVDGVQRPDLVVHLSGGRHVVVDAKVPLVAYLEAAEATDEPERQRRLAAHARHLRAHVEALAAKRYWAAVPGSPEFVVLFVPGEAFLAPALEQDPGLLETALRQRVVLATPTTLVTMLRTIGFAWQQSALTENAREVYEVGQQLYTRLGTLAGHVDKLGRSLDRAVSDYNATVGSLETRVLGPARRLHDLGLVGDDVPSPRSVETPARPLTAPVLVAAAHEAGGRTGGASPPGAAEDGQAEGDPERAA